MKRTICSFLLLSGAFLSNAQTPASSVTGANNVQAMIHADGLLFQDDQTGQFKVDGHSPIRAAGIWISGMDPGGNLKGAFQMYRDRANDYTPGIYGVSGDDWNRIFRVTGEDILIHLRDFQYDGIVNDTLASIFGWPGAGNPFFKSIHGFDLPELPQGLAPFYDDNGNGIYDPDLGDVPTTEFRGCEEKLDIPAEMQWFSFHDDTPHDLSGAYKLQLGVQANVISYRCKNLDYLNNSILVYYRLINHGLEDIDSCYFGMFVDFELGCPEDDYIAAIPHRNLFFVYNSDDVDEDCEAYDGFGENPPAVAVKLIRGPLDPFRSELPLSVLMPVNDSTAVPGTGPPELDFEYYRYLSGSWKNGEPLTVGNEGYNPGSPNFTKIIYPGFIFDPTSWAEINEGTEPGRRRMIASYGPFILQPGAVNELSFLFTFIPGGSEPGLENLWQLYSSYSEELSTNFDECWDGPPPSCKPDIPIPPLPPLPEEFILAPNPVSEWLKVEFRNFELIEVFEIYDALGRLVYETQALNDWINIPVSDFPNGVYFANAKKKNDMVGKPFLVLRR